MDLNNMLNDCKNSIPWNDNVFISVVNFISNNYDRKDYDTSELFLATLSYELIIKNGYDHLHTITLIKMLVSFYMQQKHYDEAIYTLLIFIQNLNLFHTFLSNVFDFITYVIDKLIYSNKSFYCGCIHENMMMKIQDMPYDHNIHLQFKRSYIKWLHSMRLYNTSYFEIKDLLHKNMLLCGQQHVDTIDSITIYIFNCLILDQKKDIDDKYLKILEEFIHNSKTATPLVIRSMLILMIFNKDSYDFLYFICSHHKKIQGFDLLILLQMYHKLCMNNI